MTPLEIVWVCLLACFAVIPIRLAIGRPFDGHGDDPFITSAPAADIYGDLMDSDLHNAIKSHFRHKPTSHGGELAELAAKRFSLPDAET